MPCSMQWEKLQLALMRSFRSRFTKCLSCPKVVFSFPINSAVDALLFSLERVKPQGTKNNLGRKLSSLLSSDGDCRKVEELDNAHEILRMLIDLVSILSEHPERARWMVSHRRADRALLSVGPAGERQGGGPGAPAQGQLHAGPGGRGQGGCAGAGQRGYSRKVLAWTPEPPGCPVHRQPSSARPMLCSCPAPHGNSGAPKVALLALGAGGWLRGCASSGCSRAWG